MTHPVASPTAQLGLVEGWRHRADPRASDLQGLGTALAPTRRPPPLRPHPAPPSAAPALPSPRAPGRPLSGLTGPGPLKH